MRRLLALLALCALAARGETEVQGITGECKMHTLRVRIPAVAGVAALETETLATEHVQNRWTTRAYELSPDGQALIIQRQTGFEVQFAGQRTPFRHDLSRWSQRLFRWHPDSRRVLLWSAVSSSVLLMDVRELGGKAPWKVAYDPTAGRRVNGPRSDREVIDPRPFAFEWSPAGDALFVLERVYYPHDPTRPWESALVRVGLDGERTELVRRPGLIELLSLPAERGHQGPVAGEVPLLLGGIEGLELLRAAPAPEPFLGLPARGLKNLAWSPRTDPTRLLLFAPGHQRNVPAAHRGVVLAEVTSGALTTIPLDRATNDVHTLWFSPRGTFATWATPGAVAYLRPGDAPEQATWVRCRVEGKPLEVKGARWHANERWLAITAGTALFLHDAEQGTTERLASFGEVEALSFLADPSWAGDDLLCTRYEDVSAQVQAWAPAPRFRVKRGAVKRRMLAGRALEAHLARFPLMAGAKAWQARFTTERRAPGLAPQVVQGTLHWSRGRLARCVTSGPADLAVVEGGTVLTWDGRARRELSLDEAPMELRCLALLLGGQTGVAIDDFEVEPQELVVRDDDPARWRIAVRLRGVPESPTLPRLELRDGGGRLGGWTFTEPVGRVSETRLERVDTGPIHEDVFRVPEGK